MMKCVLTFLIIAVILSISFAACDDDEVIGGPCEYNKYYGNAEIISIIDNVDDNRMDFYINFTPDDTTVREHYLFPENLPDSNSPAVVCLNGVKPSDSVWVMAQGLTVGSIHRCRRVEITKGTCAPYAFEFTEIDCAGR